jgi:hypothetical protein
MAWHSQYSAPVVRVPCYLMGKWSGINISISRSLVLYVLRWFAYSNNR